MHPRPSCKLLRPLVRRALRWVARKGGHLIGKGFFHFASLVSVEKVIGYKAFKFGCIAIKRKS